MLERRRKEIYTYLDQKEILDQVLDNALSVKFHESDMYPRTEEIQDLLSIADKAISNTDESLIFIELQLVLFLTIIQGLSLSQALSLNMDMWNSLEGLQYRGKDLLVSTKNLYCSQLVARLDKTENSSDKIFSLLDSSNTLQCLNLLLVMNGYEYVMSERKLMILFGRFLYLRHGQIRSIREFLKLYYQCDSHIELFVQLKLVDTVHYNTMMRN